MEKTNEKETFLFRVRRRMNIIWAHITYKTMLCGFLDFFAGIRINHKIYSKNERSILQYKNIYEGKSCFVIGNGPSLKIADLERIKKEGYVCFASNKIYKCFDQTDWRPDFYACIDLLLFEQNREDILREINCVRFFGHKFKPLLCDPEKRDPLIRYNGKHLVKEFPEDVVKMESGGSVTFVLIALAWMMGFKTIYLIGCDHSYKFYETITAKTNAVETTEAVLGDYFVKNYMKVGERMNVGNLDRLEKGYTIAKEHIEKNGGHIYNATRGGALEVFERKDLDEILGRV